MTFVPLHLSPHEIRTRLIGFQTMLQPTDAHMRLSRRSFDLLR